MCKVQPDAQISYDVSNHQQHLKVNNSQIHFPKTSLPEAADWLRCDFDVTSICSTAADWSRNYIGYLGCFNINDRMFRISVLVVQQIAYTCKVSAPSLHVQVVST